MKKLFVILFAVGASALMSCDNENSVNPQPLGTAKVTGTVFADFDFTNNIDEKTYDKVANKKVIVWIYDENSESLRFEETTTDANGNYSFEIQLGNRGLEVQFELADFRQNVKYTSSRTEEEIFYGRGFGHDDLYVVKGGEYIRDLYYNN